MFAIICKVNEERECELKIVAFPENDHLDFYYKHIGCDCIDIVRPYGLEESEFDDFDLVVDDEGLLKEKPIVNDVASLLYGVLKHGQPICGNAIVVKHKGPENVGMTFEEVRKVYDRLTKLVSSLPQNEA